MQTRPHTLAEKARDQELAGEAAEGGMSLGGLAGRSVALAAVFLVPVLLVLQVPLALLVRCFFY